MSLLGYTVSKSKDIIYVVEVKSFIDGILYVSIDHFYIIIYYFISITIGDRRYKVFSRSVTKASSQPVKLNKNEIYRTPPLC